MSKNVSAENLFPTLAGVCASGGHRYYGDEHDPATAPPEQRAEVVAMSGRCYCGAKRYPFGGPSSEAAET